MKLSANKEHELNLIKELKAFHGYFADCLTDVDIDSIEQNLLNDYPIFMGTNLDVEAYRTKLLKTTAEYNGFKEETRKQFEELKKKLDSAHQVGLDLESENYNLKLRCARLKVKLGEPLADDEKEALLQSLENVISE